MPPRALSDFWLLTAKVTDKTLKDYENSVRRFLRWCSDNKVQSGTRGDLDWTILEYLHEEYESNNGKGKGHIQKLLSGLQLIAPQLKGKLPLSVQALAGWRRLHPAQKHPPLTWSLTVVIAAKLAVWGKLDMAVGMLLAFAALLRIGEMTNLKVEDFLDQDADDPRVDSASRSGLRLRATKTGENLFAELKSDQVRRLLRALVAGKDRKQRIFEFSADTFRKWMKRAVVSLGLTPKYTPHSLRHGGATALYMAGVPLETILVRGRWASTKSARHYIQSGEALLLAQDAHPDLRNIGRLFAGQLCDVFLEIQRQTRAAHTGRPRPRSGQQHQRHQQQPHSQPTRHSSRHDFLVRPDYESLDEHIPNVRH